MPKMGLLILTKHVSKNKSNLKIFGSINSNKTFDLKGESNVFKLEESQFIKNISNQFSGYFKFSMGVKGEVTKTWILK